MVCLLNARHPREAESVMKRESLYTESGCCASGEQSGSASPILVGSGQPARGTGQVGEEVQDWCSRQHE